jgi:hypothetical protein
MSNQQTSQDQQAQEQQEQREQNRAAPQDRQGEAAQSSQSPQSSEHGAPADFDGLKDKKPEDLTPEELRWMADTMPGDGPGD